MNKNILNFNYAAYTQPIEVISKEKYSNALQNENTQLNKGESESAIVFVENLIIGEREAIGYSVTTFLEKHVITNDYHLHLLFSLDSSELVHYGCINMKDINTVYLIESIYLFVKTLLDKEIVLNKCDKVDNDFLNQLVYSFTSTLERNIEIFDNVVISQKKVEDFEYLNATITVRKSKFAFLNQIDYITDVLNSIKL